MATNMKKKVVILGGGTFSPIRNHLSLAAPAFGTVASSIAEKLREELPSSEWNVSLVKTAMAGGVLSLKTNEDVENYINNYLLEDESVRTIVLSVAFCDYDVNIGDRGFHGKRLRTKDGDQLLELRPSKKIIDNIRRKRPDIFLVGFKTSTNCSDFEMFLNGLKMMKRSKCNLVLANDVVTRDNIIITPEEVMYNTENREHAINELVSMITMRHDLTYDKTIFVHGENVPMNDAPKNFQKVVKHLIDRGSFRCMNGQGFTPGHFCYREPDGFDTFISSQRKADHTRVFEEGMTEVMVGMDGKTFTAVGTRKPSVGARSQWMMLKENPEYDCIVHAHVPARDYSEVWSAEQKPFQCGSWECGANTLNNLKTYEDGKFKAVMLEKHGPNVMFSSSTPAEEVIDFLEKNFVLKMRIS